MPQFPYKRVIHAGYTFIELMITVAIVGMLLVIAVPQYSAYSARAKYAEALQNLSGVKSAIMKYGIENEGFSGLPATMRAADLEQTFHIGSSDGVSYLDKLIGRPRSNLTTSRVLLDQYVDRAAMGAPDDAPDMIRLQIIYMNRNGMFQVTCRYYSRTYRWNYAAGAKYMPSECRS